MAFTKEQLQARVSDLEKALEQSAANHNALMGRIMESKELLSMFDIIEAAPEVAAE